MTERQAWEMLARRFEDNQFSQEGLCSELMTLDVTASLEIEMLRRIRATVALHPFGVDDVPDKRNDVVFCWGWPRTPEGNAARVRFCRRQVARLTRKRK